MISLNDSLGGVTQFIVDQETGEITGYKTKAGADTVYPFSGVGDIAFLIVGQVQNTYINSNYQQMSLETLSNRGVFYINQALCSNDENTITIKKNIRLSIKENHIASRSSSGSDTTTYIKIHKNGVAIMESNVTGPSLPVNPQSHSEDFSENDNIEIFVKNSGSGSINSLFIIGKVE